MVILIYQIFWFRISFRVKFRVSFRSGVRLKVPLTNLHQALDAFVRGVEAKTITWLFPDDSIFTHY